MFKCIFCVLYTLVKCSFLRYNYGMMEKVQTHFGLGRIAGPLAVISDQIKGKGKIMSEEEKEMQRKNSAARIKANNKYNEKAYDRINVAIPKGQKAEIQSAAAAVGESVNEYVKTAIIRRMESGT